MGLRRSFCPVVHVISQSTELLISALGIDNAVHMPAGAAAGYIIRLFLNHIPDNALGIRVKTTQCCGNGVSGGSSLDVSCHRSKGLTELLAINRAVISNHAAVLRPGGGAVHFTFQCNSAVVSGRIIAGVIISAASLNRDHTVGTDEEPGVMGLSNRLVELPLGSEGNILCNRSVEIKFGLAAVGKPSQEGVAAAGRLCRLGHGAVLADRHHKVLAVAAIQSKCNVAVGYVSVIFHIIFHIIVTVGYTFQSLQRNHDCSILGSEIMPASPVETGHLNFRHILGLNISQRSGRAFD